MGRGVSLFCFCGGYHISSITCISFQQTRHYQCVPPLLCHTHTHTHTHTAGYPHLALEYFDFFQAFVPLDMDHYGNVEVVFELLATEGHLVEALQVCRSYECSDVEDKFYEALLEACRISEWNVPHCMSACLWWFGQWLPVVAMLAWSNAL